MTIHEDCEKDELLKRLLAATKEIEKERNNNIQYNLDNNYGKNILSIKDVIDKKTKKQFKCTFPSSLSELSEKELPELYQPYPGILSQGSAIMYGKPKSGKSDFILGLTMRYVMGLDVLGINTDGGQAVFFGLEDSEARIWRRIESYLDLWGVSDNDYKCLLHNMDYHIEAPRIDEGLYDYLSLYIDKKPNTKLIVLDMFKNIDPEKQSRDPYKSNALVGRVLTDFCINNPGITALTTHHGRKASADNPVDAAIGTGGLVGSFDNFLSLEIKKDERILHVNGRDIDPEEYKLESYNNRYTFNLQQADGISTRKKVYLSVPSSQSYTRQEIVHGADLDQKLVDYHLKMLQEDKLVEKPEYGKYRRTKRHFFELDNV